MGTLPNRRLTPDGTLDVDVPQAFIDPDGDTPRYSVSSSAPDVVAVMAMGARLRLTAVSDGAARIRVTATDLGGLSATQHFTVTVAAAPVPFTDDPIQPAVTPGGLRRFRWTHPVLRPTVTAVKLAHLLDLREALGEAFSAAGRPVPRWTDAAPVGGATPIRAVHLTELRSAVVALE